MVEGTAFFLPFAKAMYFYVSARNGFGPFVLSASVAHVGEKTYEKIAQRLRWLLFLLFDKFFVQRIR
ncbi:hypothetical protein ACS49_03035 [Bacillus cereus]|nr:hypothetical protein ACS49_03035 [Bacillus cereus]